MAIAMIFPVRGPASPGAAVLFACAVLGSFFLMAAINFLIGTCAVRLKSILALIRAKYWLLELLSGLLIPLAFFPEAARKMLAWLPFPHIASTPLQLYLGKLAPGDAVIMLALQWMWVAALLALGKWWWALSARKMTIHGG
jgi:ABC-2 type transport system permease protein